MLQRVTVWCFETLERVQIVVSLEIKWDISLGLCNAARSLCMEARSQAVLKLYSFAVLGYPLLPIPI